MPNKSMQIMFASALVVAFVLLKWTGEWVWGYFSRHPNDWVLMAGAGFFSLTAVTVLYSVFGGIKSIIWTDVLQFFLFIGGAAAALALILGDIGWGGLSSALAAAPEKLRIIDAVPDLTKRYTIFSALLGGTLLSFATHGTDQDIVQRMLTCSESRTSTGSPRSI